MNSSRSVDDADAEMNGRSRRFYVKVRTGCQTCKIRRVKCDEMKPECMRCKSTKRVCDGYDRTTHIAQTSMKPSPFSAQGTAAERQAVFMFRTRIVSLISSSLDADFWTYSLLQEAENYKTVQHAVAALAMAYYSSIILGEQSEAQGRLSLAQYTKSINSLRQYLGKTKFRSIRQQLIVLTTSLLLVCCCVVRGAHEEACVHTRKGLALLHDWNLGAPGEPSTKDLHSVLGKYLLAAFTQLDTQARVMISARGPGVSSPWSSHHVRLSGWGSGSTKALTDASAQLEALHNEALQLRADPPALDDPCCEKSVLHKHRQRLTAWDSEFAQHLNNCPDSMPEAQELQVRRLLVDLSWALPCLNSCHARMVACQKILDLARMMLHQSIRHREMVSFKPHGTLIEALYFVATRCPYENVRRQATSLLEQHSLIEGLWESKVAARQAVLDAGAQH